MASASVGAVTVEVRLSWWLRLYLQTLGFLCCVLKTEPDWERLEVWIRRGIHVRVNGRRWRRWL